MLPGLITLLIIGLFAPFGFQKMELMGRLAYALLFGSIASLAVFLVVSLLKSVYPNHNDQWTVGKEILLVLTVIGVISLLIFFILFWSESTNLSAFQLLKLVLLNTILLSIFPVIILVLFEQYNHQKKQWRMATEINSHINPMATKTHELVQINGENGKMELQLIPEEILLLKSDGNYVEVIYGTDKLEKKLVRNRLKSLADTLPKELFFQCHKSYIINKLHVVSVDGNARNFELKLRGVADAIPVSRLKSEEMIRFLRK